MACHCELCRSVSFEKYLEEREERQASVRATIDSQEREQKRMQDFIDRMGAKASKASQAKGDVKATLCVEAKTNSLRT